MRSRSASNSSPRSQKQKSEEELSITSDRCKSAPPNFRIDPHYDKLMVAFQHYYTSLPITLCIDESPAVMRDMFKKIVSMPKQLIAPDGFIPNSKVRKLLQPQALVSDQSAHLVTESASQRLHLEQLIKRYLSDERTRETLSSISCLKDVALLRVAQSPGGTEKIRNELMANLAIEVEGLLERPCEQLIDDENLNEEDEEAMRMQKSSKLHKFARQLTKQTVLKHFEEKIKSSMLSRIAEQKAEEEVSFIGEEEDHLAEATTRSNLAPTNWRQEDDLIDRLDKDNVMDIEQRRMTESERTLPYDFVKNTLEKMAEEWGGLPRVMGIILGGVQKRQSSVDKLDAFLKSREARVGMINTMVSPSWAMVYLSNLLGSDRSVVEHLDTLADADTPAELSTSMKAQLIQRLGNGDRLKRFCAEFAETKSLVQSALVERGVPKDAAINLVTEAMAESRDAQARLANWFQMSHPQKLIEAIKSCNKDNVAALLKANTGKAEQVTMDRSADSSLLAQLDVDAKRVMQYTGKEETDDEDAPVISAPVLAKVVQKPHTPISIAKNSSDVSESMRESAMDSQFLIPLKHERSSMLGVSPVIKRKESIPTVDDEETDASYNQSLFTANYDKSTKSPEPVGTSLTSRKEIQRKTKDKPRKSVSSLKMSPEKPVDETEEKSKAEKGGEVEKIASYEEELQAALSVLDGELLLSDEDLDEILRATETFSLSVDSQGPNSTEFSVTEGTGSQPARYPEMELLTHHVKRFKVDFESNDEFMKKLASSSWFPKQEAQLKKEVVAVEIMRKITLVTDPIQLKEAELAIILLKRQYGLGLNCLQYVKKQADKLFNKYSTLIAPKVKVETRNEAFMHAVAMLSILTNCGVDVLSMLETVEEAFIQAERTALKSKQRGSVMQPSIASNELEHTTAAIKVGGMKRSRKSVKETADETEERAEGKTKKKATEKTKEEIGEKSVGKFEDKNEDEAEKLKEYYAEVENEIVDEITVEELEAMTPEERAKVVKQRKEAIEKKIRVKMMEKRATEKAEARSRPPRSRDDDSDDSHSRTLKDPESRTSDDEEGGEEEEGKKKGAAGTSRLNKKKQALLERDNESTSTKDDEFREMEESVAVATAEAKNRRRQATDKDPEKGRKGIAGSADRIDDSKDNKIQFASGSSSTEVIRLGMKKPGETVELSESLEQGVEANIEQLLNSPGFQHALGRESMCSSVKDFLVKQGKTVNAGMAPSMSLRALAGAFRDPEQAAQAEELLKLIEGELGMDDPTPGELISKMRRQMDGMPEGKMQPFNKMINLLSVFLAIESEEAEPEEGSSKRQSLTFLEQAEVDRQRQVMLSALVGDITSQLKYEYATLSELSPQQRAVWMRLDTQVDTVRECCEKIGFVVSSGTMTPELASFVTSVFAMDLVDFQAMLRGDLDMNESEQRNIYLQSQMMLEVLSWFEINPPVILKTFEEFGYLGTHERILEDPPMAQVLAHQLDIILPESYVELVGKSLFSEFATVEFVPDDTREPLERLYTIDSTRPQSGPLSSEGIASKKDMLLMMTQRLSDIKQTFKDPIQNLDPDSTLVRLSTKLMDGMNQLMESDDPDFSKSSAFEEEEDKKQILAYETSKILISPKAFAQANTLRLRRKTMPGLKLRRSSGAMPSMEISISGPVTEEEDVKQLKAPRISRAPRRSLSKVVFADDNQALSLRPGPLPINNLRVSGRASHMMMPLAGSLALIAKAGQSTQPDKSDHLVIQPPESVSHAMYGAKTSRQSLASSKPQPGGKISRMSITSSIQSKHQPSGKRREQHAREAHATGSLHQPILSEPNDLHNRVQTDAIPSMIAVVPSSDSLPLGSLNPVSSLLDVQRIVKPVVTKTHTKHHDLKLEHQQSLLEGQLPTTLSLPSLMSEEAKQAAVVTQSSEEVGSSEQFVTGLESQTAEVPGVWSWLDNLLTARTKSMIRPHKALEPVRLDAKKVVEKGFVQVRPHLMVDLLEEKVHRLQHLVDDIEEAEQWHPTMETLQPDTLSRDVDPTIEQPIQMKVEGRSRRSRISESKKRRITGTTGLTVNYEESDRRFSSSAPRLKTRSFKHKKHLETLTSLERLTTNWDMATQYLQSVIPPGQLTRLLAKIKEDSTSSEAVATLEDALLKAAQKARASDSD